MDASNSFRSRPLLTAAGMAVLAAGCASVEPRLDAWSAPAAGASWEFAQKNTGSFGKDAQLRVTRGDGTWQGKPAVALTNSMGISTMATPEQGRWHAIVGKDGKPMMSWDPPLGWEYPLAVGKTWTTAYRMTLHGKNLTIPYELSCKVESYGDLAVKAGSYKAFKIVCASTIGNEETFWMSPELGVFIKAKLTRAANSPFGPGTQESELVAQSIRP